MSFQPPEVTSTGYHRQLVKNGRPRTSTSRKWKIVKKEKMKNGYAARGAHDRGVVVLAGGGAAQLNSPSALIGYFNFNSEFGSSQFVFRFLF
jgi:hypothetical protein